MYTTCGNELDFDSVLCRTLFKFIYLAAGEDLLLVDRSNTAMDLVDALQCVFSSLALRERGPSGRRTVSVVGTSAEKLASFTSALNFPLWISD